MWQLLILLAVVSAGAAESGATTVPPPRRTLDRHAAELAWRSWLQSPESGNQNAPPRRITTKSLFITPLVCPKGQRLDGNGCVEVLTVNKEDHERLLVDQLNALFTSVPSEDIAYDYGENEPGPLQLTIPIGLDPHAAPLQAEPVAQATNSAQTGDVKVDKKDENQLSLDAGIEAELELLKLQHAQNNAKNDTDSAETSGVLNHNVMNALLPKLDKLKRDSPPTNSTEVETSTNDNQGQKEVVYGHVNVDPVLYNTEEQTETTDVIDEQTEKINEEIINPPANDSVIPNTTNATEVPSKVDDTVVNNNASNIHTLKKDGDKTKLNPENDYADIGEAIKLISRYAEVTTDDNFSKEHKDRAASDESILGTRTRQQHRRNKPRLPDSTENISGQHLSAEYANKERVPTKNVQTKVVGYYRYPWQGVGSPTPPPDYPFRHLQDYWPGQTHEGGVYASHENPRRHHHKYPHNYFKLHGYHISGPQGINAYPTGYHISGPQGINAYPMEQRGHPAPAAHARPMRSYTNNRDLYSLLGLRHWFSSESTSKR